jgi:hypothetical protein
MGKDDCYEEVKSLHNSLDRRLRMLLKKPFLSEEEELELKIVKKRKLYCKDLMEGFRDDD